MVDGIEQPSPDRDPVRELVRLAGARPTVPAARTERVRAAAAEQWRRQAQRRARTRRLRNGALVAAASLVLALALRATLPWSNGRSDRFPVQVASLHGEVLAHGANGSQPWGLLPDSRIPTGSTVITADSSRVALRLHSGHSVRLDFGSTLRLLPGGGLALDRGALYVDSGTDAPSASPLQVLTPLGRVEEIGTRFEIRLERDRLRVRLRDGAVVVESGAVRHEIGAGAELLMERDGSIRRSPIAAHDAAWSWTAEAAPILALEGRPAREFLEWYARERGLTLAFAAADVARAAAATELGGSARRLSLDEALQAVLQASRLTHRVEDDVLLIDTAR